MVENNFHKKLRQLIVRYILLGYKISKKFPDDEKFGMTSQARRSLISTLLNYTEGYARSKKAVMLNFYETSYGSLQESICVFYLATKLEYITSSEYMQLYIIKEEVAKMEWNTIAGLREECNKNN